MIHSCYLSPIATSSNFRFYHYLERIVPHPECENPPAIHALTVLVVRVDVLVDRAPPRQQRPNRLVPPHILDQLAIQIRLHPPVRREPVAPKVWMCSVSTYSEWNVGRHTRWTACSSSCSCEQLETNIQRLVNCRLNQQLSQHYPPTSSHLARVSTAARTCSPDARGEVDPVFPSIESRMRANRRVTRCYLRRAQLDVEELPIAQFTHL